MLRTAGIPEAVDIQRETTVRGISTEWTPALNAQSNRLQGIDSFNRRGRRGSQRYSRCKELVVCIDLFSNAEVLETKIICPFAPLRFSATSAVRKNSQRSKNAKIEEGGEN